MGRCGGRMDGANHPCIEGGHAGSCVGGGGSRGAERGEPHIFHARQPPTLHLHNPTLSPPKSRQAWLDQARPAWSPARGRRDPGSRLSSGGGGGGSTPRARSRVTSSPAWPRPPRRTPRAHWPRPGWLATPPLSARAAPPIPRGGGVSASAGASAASHWPGAPSVSPQLKGPRRDAGPGAGRGGQEGGREGGGNFFDFFDFFLFCGGGWKVGLGGRRRCGTPVSGGWGSGGR